MYGRRALGRLVREQGGLMGVGRCEDTVLTWPGQSREAGGDPQGPRAQPGAYLGSRQSGSWGDRLPACPTCGQVLLEAPTLGSLLCTCVTAWPKPVLDTLSQGPGQGLSQGLTGTLAP